MEYHNIPNRLNISLLEFQAKLLCTNLNFILKYIQLNQLVVARNVSINLRWSEKIEKINVLIFSSWLNQCQPCMWQVTLALANQSIRGRQIGETFSNEHLGGFCIPCQYLFCHWIISRNSSQLSVWVVIFMILSRNNNTNHLWRSTREIPGHHQPASIIKLINEQ